MAIQIEYKKPFETAWQVSSEDATSPHLITGLEPVYYQVRAYDTATGLNSNTETILASGGFIDAGSLVTSAKMQGITITDNELYPRDTGDKPFSFEAWFKITEQPSSAMVFFRAKDTGNESVLIQGQIDPSGTVRVFLNTSSGNRIGWTSSTSATVEVGVWNHIIVSYDGSETIAGLKFWINSIIRSAVDNSTGTYTGLPSLNGNFQLQLPIIEDTDTIFLRGKYNMFRWFDKELTQSEADGLYNGREPRTLDGLGLSSNCLLEQGFDSSTQSTIGTDGVAVGGLVFDTDKPWSVTDKSIIFDTVLESVFWPKIYISADWPEFITNKPYFCIYSTDHGGAGGIAWAECDDAHYNGWIERGIIKSGNQAETPWLIRIPAAKTGIQQECFLYYHIFTGGGTPNQRTDLMVTSGGVLHEATWVDYPEVFGYVPGENHLGYARVFEKQDGTYVARHVITGNPSVKYAMSTSSDGLSWVRGPEITGLTVGGYTYSVSIVPFERNGTLYGFIILNIDGGTKPAVVTLDANYIPSSIVSILPNFYTMTILNGHVEANMAYLNFKWSYVGYRNKPHFLLDYDLTQLDA